MDNTTVQPDPSLLAQQDIQLPPIQPVTANSWPTASLPVPQVVDITPTVESTPSVVESPVATLPWQQTSESAVAPIIPPFIAQTQTATSPWQSTPLPPQSPTEVTTPLMPMLDNVSIPQKKKGVPPVILGMLTLFFIAGIAGGTFLISKGVSSPTPIAPNAPISIPKAFDPNEDMVAVKTPTPGFDPNGTIDCTNVPNTAPFGNRCVATVTTSTGDVVWANGALEALTR